MSVAFLIVLAIILAFCILTFPFISGLMKDERELGTGTIEEAFPFLFSGVNNGLFEGLGKTTVAHKKFIRMMSTDENRQNIMVDFSYGAGVMTITLGYKYFREELKYNHSIPNFRNASAFRQKDEANAFVEVAAKRIHKHQLKVLSLKKPDEIINNPPVNNSYPDDIDTVSEAYGNITKEQKRALLCMGYMVAASGGMSEEVYLQLPMVREQLRFFNISWTDCKQLMHSVGWDSVPYLLKGIPKSTIVMMEPFFSAITLWNDPRMIEKLYECLEIIGYTKEEYDEISLKNKLFTQMFEIK